MKLLSYLSLACLLAIFLPSCDSETPVEKYTKKKILVMGNSSEPAGLDPHVVTGVLESRIIRGLFEGLCLEHPSKEGVNLPGAATKWEHDESYRNWTFHLQPEGKWSDGQPVTTDDFIFAYHRILNPKFGAKYASMLYFIEGAEAYNKNYLGKLLLGNDPNFPVKWEELKNINFRGDDELKIAKFEETGFDYAMYLELSKAEQEKFRKFQGLDKLFTEILEDIRKDPSLFNWPSSINDETKTLILDTLISHKKSPTDLWDKANVGVFSDGDKTLKLKLKAATPFLPEVTKHYTWFPIPKHVVEKHGPADDQYKNKWTEVDNMVSNGAFKLTTWQFNDRIEISKNPHYWDAGVVKLNAIRFLPIFNQYTESRMFFNDQLHVTYKIPSELIEYCRNNYPDNFRLETYLGTNFIRCNMTSDKLKDIRVRKALSMTVDRQKLIDKVLKGGQQPATGMVPAIGDYKPSLHVKPSCSEEDIAEARKLLAEAGFNESNPLKLDFLTVDKDESKRTAEAFQDMWKKALGIEISIKQAEWKTYQDKMSNLEYDLSTGGWIGDYPDPTTFLDMWKKGDGNNRTGWGSEAFENFLKQSETAATPQERLRILKQAETVFLEDHVIIPFFWYTSVYLIDTSVQNWHPLLLNSQPYKFIDLK